MRVGKCIVEGIGNVKMLIYNVIYGWTISFDIATELTGQRRPFFNISLMHDY